jgi:hypothetical protein
MTRRPVKKPARKKVPRKSRKTGPQVRKAPLDDFVVSAAKALRLTIERSWMPAVRGHLQVTLAHGSRVTSFALPDDTEPAPVFEA